MHFDSYIILYSSLSFNNADIYFELVLFTRKNKQIYKKGITNTLNSNIACNPFGITSKYAKTI